MENAELIGLLETVLGPVVANLSSSLNELLEQPSTRAADGQEPGTPSHGTVTSLLASRPDVGLAILDAATLRIRVANASLLNLLGRSGRPADATDRQLDELAPQLAGTEIDDAFKHVAATGYTFAAIIAQDATPGPTYLRCALGPIRQRNGTFDTLLLTLIDISAEVAARETLLERSRVARQRAAIADAEQLRAAVRSTTSDLLNGALSMEDALARIGEQIATVGDGVAIFALGDGNVLQLATLHHRDAGQHMRLRAAFTEDGPRPDGNMIAQVALTGQSLLISHWDPQHTEQLPDALRPDFVAAHIESLITVPMRAMPHTVGVLLLFSVQSDHSGTGRTYQPADVALLQELGDQVALAIQTVLLREDVRSTQAEHAAVLEASTDGIAIYDASGHLRLINPIGRELLSRPVEAGPDRGPVSGPALFKRTFLDAAGRPLQSDDLPWSRALRGERVGDIAPESLTVEWAGGVRRMLQVRAIPIAGDDSSVHGAVASMRAAPDASAAAPADESASHAGAPAGEVEWAHWRETMELLDEAVVLCEPDGTAVFINAAGRVLLNLPSDLVTDEDSRLHGNLWEYVFRPDGSPLPVSDSPVTLALAGRVVRAQPTSIALADDARRTIMWDARRIDRADGATLGVALIAWPAASDSIDTQATQPASPHLIDSEPKLPTTTLLPGRKLLDHLPSSQQAALNGHERGEGECDLTEVCAREARAHHDTRGRRLEIRLPRRRVLVMAESAHMERAVTSLISAAAGALPAGAPLHLAVWVERSVGDASPEYDSMVPQGIDIGHLNTLMLTPGHAAEIAAPTRAVAPGVHAGAASVAIVRVCSPDVRAPATETEQFTECRALIEQVGGRAWARVDPVLGPTFSFSVPVMDAQN